MLLLLLLLLPLLLLPLLLLFLLLLFLLLLLLLVSRPPSTAHKLNLQEIKFMKKPAVVKLLKER